MRRIVYTCDRCGREIRTSEENQMAIAIDFAMREDNDTSLQQPATEEIRNAMSDMLGRDYCYDCVEKIVSYMKNVVDETAEARADAMFKEIGRLTDLKESLIQQVDRANEENACLRGEVEELNGRIADMRRETLAVDAKKAADAAVSSNNKKKSEDRPPKPHPPPKSRQWRPRSQRSRNGSTRRRCRMPARSSRLVLQDGARIASPRTCTWMRPR